MSKRIPIIMALLAMASSCGEDNFPPEACGSLQDEELYINETELIALCFNDPEGADLSATATALDPSIVEAVIQGGARALQLRGRAVGETVVSITATDPEGQTAEASLAVVVPNRVPESSDLPDVKLTAENPSADILLTDYFTDPDDHELTFMAEVDREGVVAAEINGSILTVSIVGNGEAIVRVTANDGHGGEAQSTGTVSIRVRAGMVNDQFESTSLGDIWLIGGTVDAGVSEGWAQVTATTVDGFSGIETRVTPSTDWNFKSRVRAGSDDAYPTLVVATNDSAIRLILVLLGGDIRRLDTASEDLPETNIVAAYCCNPSGNLGTIPEWIALSDSIPEMGTEMDVEVQMTATVMNVSVNGTQVLSAPVEFTISTGQIVIPQTAEVVALAPFVPFDLDSVRGDEHTFYDFIDVSGIPVEDAGPAGDRLTISFPRKVEVHR